MLGVQTASQLPQRGKVSGCETAAAAAARARREVRHVLTAATHLRLQRQRNGLVVDVKWLRVGAAGLGVVPLHEDELGILAEWARPQKHATVRRIHDLLPQRLENSQLGLQQAGAANETNRERHGAGNLFAVARRDAGTEIGCKWVTQARSKVQLKRTFVTFGNT